MKHPSAEEKKKGREGKNFWVVTEQTPDRKVKREKEDGTGLTGPFSKSERVAAQRGERKGEIFRERGRKETWRHLSQTEKMNPLFVD